MKRLLIRLQPAWERVERKLDRWPAAAQRGLLYSLLMASVLGGYHHYTRLRGAVNSLAPAQKNTFYAGELGGNNLRNGLLESGSSGSETAAILKAVKKIGGTGRQYRGDEYRIARSTSGEFQHLTLTRGQQRIIVTVNEGKFKATVSKAPLRISTFHSSGTITNSLWVSMMKGGAGDEVIQKYTDVFQWTVDFLTETRDGDRYSLIWTERRTPDGRVWGRDIVAALYDGHISGKQIGILFDDAYYDQKGNSLERMFLRAPLNYRHISSTFSTGRWHPILKIRRPHMGIDYAAARGTPVVSIGTGHVTAVGYNGGLGNRIEIKHTPTYSSLYGHLERYAGGLRVGMHVRQGQVIGYVGSTGLATGPHLHFQFSRGGTWVNFQRLKLPKANSVPNSRLAEFNTLRDAYLKSLGEAATASGSGTAR